MVISSVLVVVVPVEIVVVVPEVVVCPEDVVVVTVVIGVVVCTVVDRVGIMIEVGAFVVETVVSADVLVSEVVVTVVLGKLLQATTAIIIKVIIEKTTILRSEFFKKKLPFSKLFRSITLQYITGFKKMHFFRKSIVFQWSSRINYDIIKRSRNSEVFMIKTLKKLIQKNQKIIILRHKDPDLDAYGSQFGLYYALKAKYPTKQILAIGDTNSLNSFQAMDNVTREEYKDSLVFILDTVSKQMLLGDDYLDAKTLVFIDHHLNRPEIHYDQYFLDEKASSCSEIVFQLLKQMKIPVPTSAAKALLMGIISDTGRFVFNNTNERTFFAAGELVQLGVNIQEIYNTMYSESLEMKKVKAYFFNTVQYTRNNVAFRKNDEDFLKQFNLDVHTASRGLVNQMAGAKEVPIWANFTYDPRIGKILCELRSRFLPIVDVARKYGGGGHAQACGCTVDTWEDTEKVLKDLDDLAEVNRG